MPVNTTYKHKKNPKYANHNPISPSRSRLIVWCSISKATQPSCQTTRITLYACSHQRLVSLKGMYTTSSSIRKLWDKFTASLTSLTARQFTHVRGLWQCLKVNKIRCLLTWCRFCWIHGWCPSFQTPADYERLWVIYILHSLDDICIMPSIQDIHRLPFSVAETLWNGSDVNWSGFPGWYPGRLRHN